MRKLVLFIFIFLTAISHAATFTVDLKGGGDFTDIQSAINAADDGDTVLVKSGEYVITSPVNFHGKAITIESEAGSEETIIRMSENPDDPERASVVIFESDEGDTSVLDGFTLEGGRGTKWGGDDSLRYGGGILCINSASPMFTNCTITGNSADFRGGGIFCNACSPTLNNCTISDNSARYDGGVCLSWGCSSLLTNCTIRGNSGDDEGGGVCCYQASPTLANCTISGNTGGGVYCMSGSLEFLNCIVWNNAGGSVFYSTPAVSFSCIEGENVWPGEGNINVDPLFTASGYWDDNGTPDAESDDVWFPGDYHLQEGSPCIDTGTVEGAPFFDIENYGRPCGDGVDMGAYESGECPYSEGSAFLRGEMNMDGTRNIADAVSLLSHLFGGAGPLPEPFETCDIDMTLDELGCESFKPCSEP